MDSSDALSRSRYRERRLKNADLQYCFVKKTLIVIIIIIIF